MMLPTALASLLALTNLAALSSELVLARKARPATIDAMRVTADTAPRTRPRRIEPPAPEDEWSFTWQAPAHCPDELIVRGYISERLDRPLTAWAPRGMYIAVQIDRQPDSGWRAEVMVASVDGEAERVLEHPDSCDALARGVALVIALAIETRSQTDSLQRPASEPVQPPPPRRTTPTRATTWSFVAAPYAGTTAGMLPRVTVSPGGAVTVGRNDIRWRVDGRFDWPRELVLADREPKPRATFSAWELGASIGRSTLNRKRVHAWLGVGALAARITAEPVDLVDGATQHAPWFAVLAGAYGELSLGRHIVLTVALEPFAALWRPHFVVRGIGDVHRPAPGGVRVGVGIGLRSGRSE